MAFGGPLRWPLVCCILSGARLHSRAPIECKEEKMRQKTLEQIRLRSELLARSKCIFFFSSFSLSLKIRFEDDGSSRRSDTIGRGSRNERETRGWNPGSNLHHARFFFRSPDRHLRFAPFDPVLIPGPSSTVELDHLENARVSHIRSDLAA